jgi:hypothetical protein
MELNKGSNTEVSCDDSLHQSRFKITVSFLQLVAIPLNITSLSKAQNLCYTAVVVCYYSTFMCALMDEYVHRYDLMETMGKTRMAIAFCLGAWMHLSLRYVKS